MESKLTNFISILIEDSKEYVVINSQKKIGTNTLFNLNLENLNQKDFEDFVNNNKKYDLIINELYPTGHKIKSDNLNMKIPETWINIYKSSKHLKKEGKIVVSLMPSFSIDMKSRKFIKKLNLEKIYLDAILEVPLDCKFDHTNIRPVVFVFKKSYKPSNIFIGSLEETEQLELLYNNYKDNIKGDNLAKGDIISIKEYNGIQNYKLNKRIDSLKTQYKEYNKYKIKDVCNKINITKDSHRDLSNKDHLYIPKIGTLTVYSNINDLDKKHQNYYQLEVNNEITTGKFLEKYFKSDIAQLSLKTIMQGNVIKSISKNRLLELEISIPNIKIQNEIIESYNLLNNINDNIKKIEENLSLNPNNARAVTKKLMNTLDTLTQLSKNDKLLILLRNGESLKIEFKSTFSKNIYTKKVDNKIEMASLKTIAGFLNRDGGVLLIGVKDDGNIYGIENDNYKSDDKYLLRFKNIIRDRIGKDIFEQIDYEIIKYKDKKILFVECGSSDYPVYIGDEFYIRTNPATEQLKGAELVNYINKHFN